MAAAVVPLHAECGKAIKDGPSFKDAKIDYQYGVTAAIIVENWTNFELVNPMVSITSGVIVNSPVNIKPGFREIMTGHKTDGAARGSCGVVSWKIEDRRAVIMWSAPFDFNIYSNWMAVGMTRLDNVPHNENWFDEMYNGASTESLAFQRAKYEYEVPTVSCQEKGLIFAGNMNTTHNAEIKIVLYPKDESCYARSIKAKISKK